MIAGIIKTFCNYETQQVQKDIKYRSFTLRLFSHFRNMDASLKDQCGRRISFLALKDKIIRSTQQQFLIFIFSFEKHFEVTRICDGT